MNIKVQILTDYVFRQKSMHFVNSIYFLYIVMLVLKIIYNNIYFVHYTFMQQVVGVQCF